MTPKIGIFISADTIVPDPYSSQDFNRYMYVKGNPIKYSDPTGHTYYIYYDKELYPKQADAERREREPEWGSKNVKMVPVKDMHTDLVPSWNKSAVNDRKWMGASFLFHGMKHKMNTEGSGITTKIGMKKMKAEKAAKYGLLSNLGIPKHPVRNAMLRFLTCNAGRLTKGENLAQATAKRFNMPVWAMDGSLSYMQFYNNYWPRLSPWHGFLNATGLGNYSGPNVFYKFSGLILNYPLVW